MRETLDHEVARALVPHTYRCVPRFTDEERAALNRWQAKLDESRESETKGAAIKTNGIRNIEDNYLVKGAAPQCENHQWDGWKNLKLAGRCFLKRNCHICGQNEVIE